MEFLDFVPIVCPYCIYLLGERQSWSHIIDQSIEAWISDARGEGMFLFIHILTSSKGSIL